MGARGRCNVEERETVAGREGGTLVVCPLSLLYLVGDLFVCEVVDTRDSNTHTAGRTGVLRLPRRSLE